MKQSWEEMWLNGNREDGKYYNSDDIVKAAKMSKRITVNNVVEKSVISSDVEMSTFSSWGTTNELDIKPEIAAPGGNIKSTTSGTDSYEVMSGTSMASPYIAGCEATIINAMREKGIDIDGMSKIDYMKNILMKMYVEFLNGKKV